MAGTNGKGSVVAIIGAVLAAAGLSVGSMPKPHLVSYRERIAIDGAAIEEDAFAAAVARIVPAVERVAGRRGEPTEFEFLTAAAVVELARRRVDVALVEVGLGGRLDATNALDLGVAVVTNVQHDHERHLGRTLRSIATEKAAIIKRGNLAVTGARGRGLGPVLERASAVAAPLRRAGAGGGYRVVVRETSWDGVLVDARTPHGELSALRIGLLGRHQGENAAVALATLDALRDRWQADGSPLEIGESEVRRGLASARWPGRLELVPGGPLGAGRILLDGAHNPAGVRALRRALEDLGVRHPVLVFGAMATKRVTGMLRALASLDALPIFTRVPAGDAAPPARLAETWKRLTGQPALVEEEPAAAVRRAADAAVRAEGDPVIVCGSLYLVGAVRGLLVDQGAAA